MRVARALALALGVLARGAGSAYAQPASDPASCCWCDADTPATRRVTTDASGFEHELVFSDEFETQGRDFLNGRDMRWTALDKSDDAIDSPLRYMSAAITTVRDRGAMVPSNKDDSGRVWRAYAKPYHSLRIETKRMDDHHLAKASNRSISGGMLQSWDKFCFTGGVIEIRARVETSAALRLFGNLGRAIHAESTRGLWPYSYEGCDLAYESRAAQSPGAKQRISGCDLAPGAGLNAYQGRGAAELDVLSVGASASSAKNRATLGLQISPAIPRHFRPDPLSAPRGFERGAPGGSGSARSTEGTWYRELSFGGNTSRVPPALPASQSYGSPFADSLAVRASLPRARRLGGGAARAVASLARFGRARSRSRATLAGSCRLRRRRRAPQADISPLRGLSERYRTFRLEWQEGDGGHLRWSVDGDFAFEVPAAALGKYSVCSKAPGDEGPVCEGAPARTLPAEPMSIVLGSAFDAWAAAAEPADGGAAASHVYIDYVRVWQRRERTNVGCNPPDHPTREYIDAHAAFYGEPALPRGYDSCAERYPLSSARPPLRPPDASSGVWHVSHKRKARKEALLIGYVIIAIAAAALGVVTWGVVSSYVWSRRDTHGRTAQHGGGVRAEVRAAMTAPILRTMAKADE
jgi:hypothetical protein